MILKNVQSGRGKKLGCPAPPEWQNVSTTVCYVEKYVKAFFISMLVVNDYTVVIVNVNCKSQKLKLYIIILRLVKYVRKNFHLLIRIQTRPCYLDTFKLIKIRSL